jgi:hypothetical protein
MDDRGRPPSPRPPRAKPRPLLTSALPHRAVQALLELARAHLALTDVAGARILLREARYILRHRPHLGILPLQAALVIHPIGGMPVGLVAGFHGRVRG